MEEAILMINSIRDELSLTFAVICVVSFIAYMIAKCAAEDEGRESYPVFWGTISILALLAWLGVTIISPEERWEYDCPNIYCLHVRVIRAG